MRDNHDGYPEIVNAYDRDGQYFGVVRLVRADETVAVEFGVSVAGYKALRRILTSRPFDKMPGIPYRYFFCGSYSVAVPGTEIHTFAIRVEQGDTAKNIDFNVPRALLANLLWFRKLKSLEEASGLKRVDA